MTEPSLAEKHANDLSVELLRQFANSDIEALRKQVYRLQAAIDVGAADQLDVDRLMALGVGLDEVRQQIDRAAAWRLMIAGIAAALGTVPLIPAGLRSGWKALALAFVITIPALVLANAQRFSARSAQEAVKEVAAARQSVRDCLQRKAHLKGSAIELRPGDEKTATGEDGR